jgi:hypothetical protein
MQILVLNLQYRLPDLLLFMPKMGGLPSFYQFIFDILFSWTFFISLHSELYGSIVLYTKIFMLSLY